jgi:hypothetical protein
MKVHSFNGPAIEGAPCQAITNEVVEGRTIPLLCGREREARVHRFEATSGCYHPEVKVEVFVGRDVPLGGIHYATVAWVRENNGDWYSAWFSPHNQPGVYHRAEAFDALTPNLVGLHVTALMMGGFDEAKLIEAGITNQYMPKETAINR